MDEAQGKEIWFLNRDVLVVRPAQPFVDWALSLEDEGVLDVDVVLASSNAFLVPECDTDEETWAWVRGHCDTIFEYMLHDWSAVPEEWPENRGWSEFERWFTVEHVAMAWDLVDEPLSSEAPTGEVDPADWDA